MTSVQSERTTHEARVLKINQWPFWLQMVVVTPHAILAAVLVGVWWPKSNKEWLRWSACFCYLVLFYFVVIR